jgi:peptide deformylase
MTFVNPEFVERDGCSSRTKGASASPASTRRSCGPSRAILKGLDRSGQPHQQEADGLLARAFQHEMDHLDGLLFVDRLRGIKREMIVRKIRKMTRAGKW